MSSATPRNWSSSASTCNGKPLLLLGLPGVVFVILGAFLIGLTTLGRFVNQFIR